jgi:hypothetical protein
MEYLPHKYNMDTIKRFGTLGIGIRALTKVQGQPLGPKRYFSGSWSYVPPLDFTLSFQVMTMLLASKPLIIMNGLSAGKKK